MFSACISQTAKLALLCASLLAFTPTSSAADTSQNIRYLGRVNPSTKQLSWPGTGIAFNFVGTSAAVNFSQSTGTNSATFIIDGGAPVVYKDVSAGYIYSPTVSSGTHTALVYHRSEAAYGTLSFGGVYSPGGAVGTAPAALSRRIEFIGDSITVGYGEAATMPCTNTADVEDAPDTYGAMTSKNLNADFSLVAWSGKGLTRNVVSTTTDTSPLMPELWTRYGALDADNSYTFPKNSTPQAVVINLGTNDYSYIVENSSGQPTPARPPINGTAFAAAYVKFVKTVQTHYPAAHFFLCSSPMLNDQYPSTADMQHTSQVNAIKSAVAQLNTPLVQFVDFPSETLGQQLDGCDGHPSPSGHQAMANILTPAIKSALGW